MIKLERYLRSHLKIRHLHLMLALSEIQHIGRTADYLNISQPALSRALKDLEDGLGVTLFKRSTREISPTEHGEAFIYYAQKILNQISNMRDEFIDISEGNLRRISIAVLPAATPMLMPQFIENIRINNAEINTIIHEVTMGVGMSLLQIGDIDFVVGNLVNQNLSSKYGVLRLYRDPICLVVRKEHPLSAVTNLNLRDLSDYPLLLPPAFTQTRKSLDQFLMNEQLEISKRQVESVSTLTNMGVLRATDTIGFLARQVASFFEEREGITILPLDIGDIYIDVGLIWMHQKTLSVPQQAVIDTFKSVFNLEGN